MNVKGRICRSNWSMTSSVRLEEESVTIAKAMEGSLSVGGGARRPSCVGDILAQIGFVAPAAANEAFPEKKL